MPIHHPIIESHQLRGLKLRDRENTARAKRAGSQAERKRRNVLFLLPGIAPTRQHVMEITTDGHIRYTSTKVYSYWYVPGTLYTR